MGISALFAFVCSCFFYSRELKEFLQKSFSFYHFYMGLSIFVLIFFLYKNFIIISLVIYVGNCFMYLFLCSFLLFLKFHFFDSRCL